MLKYTQSNRRRAAETNAVLSCPRSEGGARRAASLLLSVLLTAASAYADSAALYRCDENGGSTVLDSSGNGNDGANSNVDYTADTAFPHPDNFALVFDHTHDAITIPAGPDTNLNSFTALTLEARIKPTTTTGLHYVLWADDGPFQVYVNNDLLFFSLIGDSGSLGVNSPFTATDVWTHVAGTYDGATATLYVDGSPVSSASGAVGTIQVSTARNIIRIGNDETADFGTFDRDFRGVIDDVRIVDHALDPAEVEYDAGHSFTPGATPASGGAHCTIVSAGAAVSGSSIINAGQTLVGKADNGSIFLTAGGIPCLLLTGPTAGDCDGNGDVGLNDLPNFVNCLNGPAGGLDAGCDCADFNGDANVDLLDYAGFQSAFSG